MTIRDDRLQVLLSQEERKQLNEASDKFGLKPSAYARMLILRGMKQDDS